MQASPAGFKSVISRSPTAPTESSSFSFQGAVEEVIEDSSNIPVWNSTQTSDIAMNLIRFLELKVLMEDYDISTLLLAPTPLIDRAWYALAKKKGLYEAVTSEVQEFHARPLHPIQYSGRPSKRRTKKKTLKEYLVRVERTQSLMKCYYPTVMPEDSILRRKISKGRQKEAEEKSYDDYHYDDGGDALSISQYSALTHASSVNIYSQVFHVLWKKVYDFDIFDAACGKVESTPSVVMESLCDSEEITLPMQKITKPTIQKKWESFKSTVGFMPTASQQHYY